MKHFRKSCESIVAMFLGSLFLLSCGCEDDSSNFTSSGSASAELDADFVEDPRFPDGLHPTSAASETVAAAFAGQLAPIAGSVPNVVVCVGDSITAGGYPGPLAGMTGMQVNDEGKSGERSGAGLGRIAGVLNTHKPDYICVLYGANNIIDGSPVSEVVGDLTAMVDAARNAGAIPVVGTLTPMSGSYGRHQDDVDALNAGIRGTVGGSGARIADVASRF